MSIDLICRAHAAQQAKGPGCSLRELNVKPGDIVTAIRSCSWICKGRQYLVGNYNDSETVNIGEYEPGKQTVFDMHQGLDSKLWQSQILKT